MATAGSRGTEGVLERYCLDRLDLAAGYLRPLAAAADEAAIKAMQGLLEAQEAVIVGFGTNVAGALALPDRGEFEARLSALLHSRTLEHVAAAYQEQYDRQQEVNRSRQTVTQAVIERRKTILRAYRKTHGLTVTGFARKLGLDKSTINGIMREDFNRASTAAQRDLLHFVGVTRDDWYSDK